MALLTKDTVTLPEAVAAKQFCPNCWTENEFRLPVQAAVASLTEDTVSAPGGMVAKQLRPTMATSNAPLSATNLLHELDSAAQEVISSVAAAQVMAAFCQSDEKACRGNP